MRRRFFGAASGSLVLILAWTAQSQVLSSSALRPSMMSPDGVLQGHFAGGNGPTSYYLSADLHKGTLISQLSFNGRANTDKKLELQLLKADMSVADSYYVMSTLDAADTSTKSFVIDSSGPYIFRLVMSGPEAASYCVLFGGSALPEAKAPRCKPSAAAAAAVQPFEVVKTTCEERLRIDTDILFQFDRYQLQPSAGQVVSAVANRLRTTQNPVTVEGYTDSKGTDAYNQVLSERRASSVEAALVERGLPKSRFNVIGFGKRDPIAPNQNPDGSDNPTGRQQNRRVEVVINTCT